MFGDVQRQSRQGGPENTEALASLGELAAATGKYEEGIADLQQAIQLSQGHPESVDYSRRLAWILATAPPPNGNPAQALSLAEDANQQSGDAIAPYQSTLAAASAANGRFPDAQQAARRALAGAQHLHDLELVRRAQEQIQAYGAGKIWVESAVMQSRQAPPLSPTTAPSPN